MFWLILVQSYLFRRYFSTKKDAEALEISSDVKKLEQQLLQLEKISKAEVSKRICSKDETSIMDLTTENENDYDQVKSKSASLSAIQLLKKQFKRYQALIGKIDDLCTRIVSTSPHLQILKIHCATYLYLQNAHNKWCNSLRSRSAYLCLSRTYGENFQTWCIHFHLILICSCSSF